MNSWRDERGFTLAELLVVVAVMAFLLAAVVLAQQSGIQAYALGSARVEVQQNGRVALDRLTRDIREAFAITGQTATGFTLQYDWNQDGLVDTVAALYDDSAGTPCAVASATCTLHPNAVVYAWAGAGSPLMRQGMGIDAQALAIANAIDSVSFTYPTANKIAVTIRTATEKVVADNSAGDSMGQMTTEVMIRNVP